MKAALEDGATKVHDDLTSNLCYDWGFVEENKDAVDEAFRAAAHVTTLELVNNRLVANPMEPRVAVGDFARHSGESTLYTTSQNPHVIRLLMGAFVLGIPEHKLRVVAPDVGGGFGTKIFHYAEEAFCTFAAKAMQPAGEVDLDPVGGVHVGRAWPRPRDQDRAGAGRGQQLHRDAHRHAGQHGRVSVDLRALGADLAARHADGGQLQDAADLREREGGLHQHRAGRRLSRRGPARGDLPARARDRQGGARAGRRSDRAAAAELHHRVSLCHAGGGGIRHRRLSRHDGQAGARSPISRASRRGARRARRRGKLRGSRRQLLYRGLRHRAVEPGGPARRAGGLVRNPPRCGSTPPAASW